MRDLKSVGDIHIAWHTHIDGTHLVGWPWLDVRYAPSCSITTTLSRTGREESNMEKSLLPTFIPILSSDCWADTIWSRISLWSVWVSCDGSVPSQDLLHCQCGTMENVVETVMMLCQCCTAVAKALGCYQSLPSYQWKAQHCEVCCGEV